MNHFLKTQVSATPDRDGVAGEFMFATTKESERVRILDMLDLFDGEANPVFDAVTRLASSLLRVPVALVSLLDDKCQRFASSVGTDLKSTPIEISFCVHAVESNSLLVVEDSLLDKRFSTSPLVSGDPNIRFYAGAPVRNLEGVPLGTLCVLDTEPRHVDPSELSLLVDLANIVTHEISLRQLTRAADAQRTEVKELLQEVYDYSGVGIAILSRDLNWLLCNDKMCELAGYPRDELITKTLDDITYVDDINQDHLLRDQIRSGAIKSYSRDKRYVAKNGDVRWIHLTVTAKGNGQNKPEHLIAIVKDINDRKAAESKLDAVLKSLEEQVEVRTRDLQTANTSLSESFAQQLKIQGNLEKRELELSMILESANDAYVCMGGDGLVTAWNRQAVETFGWSVQEAVGKPLEDLIIPEALRAAHRAGMQRFLSTGKATVLNKRIELSAVRKDGAEVPIELCIRPLSIDGQTIFAAFLHDITERKQVERLREREARYDALTGLANRRALFEQLPLSMDRARRANSGLAILFIDLDGFKPINDAFGHAAGDRVLQAVARRLDDRTRQTDLVYRLGGDEFTVVFENLANPSKDAPTLAADILEKIQVPIVLEMTTAVISASIGVALFTPPDSVSPDELISYADVAMYEAKRSGKSRVCIANIRGDRLIGG